MQIKLKTAVRTFKVTISLQGMPYYIIELCFEKAIIILKDIYQK